MTERQITGCATLLGAVGVICGAFGAHALRDSVAPADLAIWQTAVSYQLWHVLALLLVAREPRMRPAPQLLIAGITIFSGSLYLLVLTQQRWLGAITPIGGVLLILAWLTWSYRIWRR